VAGGKDVVLRESIYDRLKNFSCVVSGRDNLKKSLSQAYRLNQAFGIPARKEVTAQQRYNDLAKSEETADVHQRRVCRVLSEVVQRVGIFLNNLAQSRNALSPLLIRLHQPVPPT